MMLETESSTLMMKTEMMMMMSRLKRDVFNYIQIPQQQLAQVITPSGQIQLAQIQPAQTATSQAGTTTNYVQNANGTITIQVYMTSNCKL